MPAPTTIQLPLEVDIDQERADLYATLQHIEDLRHQHPYDATGAPTPAGHTPIPTPTSNTHSDTPVWNCNANTNANLAHQGLETAAKAPEMAA